MEMVGKKRREELKPPVSAAGPVQETSEPDGAERRRSHREPVITLGMLRTIEDGVEFPDATQVLITNVSLHGVGFRCPNKIDTQLLYMIAIGVGPLHLSSRLKIVRLRMRNDGTYDVGAEFC